MGNETYTNDIWNMYFHDPYDENWSLQSYVRFATMNSPKGFWNVHELLKDKVQSGMFFLMREHVFPCWDDDNNRKGGCLSIKVLKQDMKEFWESLCVRLLGETLLLPEYQTTHWDNINGISTSPKKHFCIIKIWLRSEELNSKVFYNVPSNYYGDILYRANIETIEQNNQTISQKETQPATPTASVARRQHSQVQGRV
jgi:hypothetical protein